MCVLLSPYSAVYNTYVHLDGLIRLEMIIPPSRQRTVREGAAADALPASRNLHYGHVALLCMQSDTIEGPFFFPFQNWLNSPTGGSKRPMPHATRPPASRAEEAIAVRQHLLCCT